MCVNSGANTLSAFDLEHRRLKATHPTLPSDAMLKRAVARGQNRAQQGRNAELRLLSDFACGKKTFEQVKADADTFGFRIPELKKLIGSNAARGVTRRLADLTGVSKESLHFESIRYKQGVSSHPFVLPSAIVEQMLRTDDKFLEIEVVEAANGVAASSFLHSPEYLEHEAA